MKEKMKQMKYVCQSLAITLLGAISLTACGDDEHYDFPGDAYNRVYMPSKTTAYEVISTPLETMLTLDYELSLSCTQESSETIRATVEVDNSLIGAYNEANGTNYAAMPDGVLVMENVTMTIEPGTQETVEPMRITATDDAAVLVTLTNKGGYLVPLRIVSAEGGNARPSTNMSTQYLAVSYSELLIDSDATEADIKGTLVADQSGWTATTNGRVETWFEPIETLFDGDASTSCYISGDDVINIDIDMGREYSFDAITLYESSSYGWGEPSVWGSLSSGMTISTSSDGTTWSPIGKIEKDASVYCIFYAPVTTRYIRLSQPNTSYWSNTITAGVFNVYETN